MRSWLLRGEFTCLSVMCLSHADVCMSPVCMARSPPLHTLPLYVSACDLCPLMLSSVSPPVLLLLCAALVSVAALQSSPVVEEKVKPGPAFMLPCGALGVPWGLGESVLLVVVNQRHRAGP